MNRLLIVSAALAAMLGSAGLAQAQSNFPPPPPPLGSAIGTGPTMTHGPYSMAPPPPPLSGTRENPAAAPGCGAASPQGGVPTSTNWGNCP
jgi:hypothetical protein